MGSIAAGIAQLTGWPAYLLIAALVFGETAVFLGFVLPGEAAVVLGGVLASRGQVSIVPLTVIVVIAAILGPLVGYEIGRRMGDRLFASRALQRIPGGVTRARSTLQARGGLGVLIGRFVAILRAVVPAAAGAAPVRYRTFLFYNVVGGIIWGVGYCLLGYLAGSAYAVVEKRVGTGLAILIAALVLVAVGIWAVRRHRATASAGAAAAGAAAGGEAAGGEAAGAAGSRPPGARRPAARRPATGKPADNRPPRPGQRLQDAVVNAGSRPARCWAATGAYPFWPKFQNFPNTSSRRCSRLGRTALTWDVTPLSTSPTAMPRLGPRSIRTVPIGSTSMLRPIPVGAPGAGSAGSGTWPAAATHTVFSIARAPDQGDPVLLLEEPGGPRGRHHDQLRAARRERPRVLGETDVVAGEDADPEPGEVAEDGFIPRCDQRGLPLAERIVKVDLAVGRGQLAGGVVRDHGVVHAPARRRLEYSGHHGHAGLPRGHGKPAAKRAVERLRRRPQVAAEPGQRGLGEYGEPGALAGRIGGSRLDPAEVDRRLGANWQLAQRDPHSRRIEQAAASH